MAMARPSGCPRRVAPGGSGPVFGGRRRRRQGEAHLFSLGKPSGDLLAALGALDRFERAIVECDETQRLNCLAILDRLTASDRPRGSH
jgi:hypothetical protein